MGRRCGSDLILLWLWLRPAPTAPIRPPAWESPYAVGVALKRQKTKKKKKKNLGRYNLTSFLFQSFSMRPLRLSGSLSPVSVLTVLINTYCDAP